MARKGSRPVTQRQYPRTARLNELLREIVADELERIDDERLELVTVTAVEVEPDMRHALVLFDTIQGEDADAEVLEALGEARIRLQRAIGRQARVKRVPLLAFAPDPAVRQGERIDAILRDIEPELEGDEGREGAADGGPEAGTGAGDDDDGA